MAAVPPDVAQERSVGALVRDLNLRASRSEARRWARDVALLAGLYYGTAKLGFELKFTGPVAAIVWLPAGVAIAFLGLRGLSAWPGAVIGDFLATDYGTLSIGGGLGQTAGNIAEVVVGALLLRRAITATGGAPLRSVRGVGYTLAAIAAGTATSAVVGPASLVLAGTLGASHLLTVSRTWFLGDASGAVLIVPLALAWFRRPWPSLTGARLLEAGAMGVAVPLLLWLATRSGDSLAYLVFPALMLATIRFGSRGGTLAVLLTAAFVVRATTSHQGPFSYRSIDHSILETQLFIAVSSVSVLLVVALVAERELAAARLSQAQFNVVRARQLERHALERNLHDGVQQRLLSLLMQIVRMRGTATAESTQGQLRVAEQGVRSAIEELRDLASGTFPSALTELGLAGAIVEIAAQSSIPVEIGGLPHRHSDVAAEAAAYYVVAEALSNAQKYSRARQIQIDIEDSEEAFTLHIADDGVGGACEEGGSGLAGLRERVESFGGTLELSSEPDGGTRISAVIPTE